MPIDHQTSRYQLRLCVEALVAGAPSGITTRRLRDEVSRRANPAGRDADGSVDVLRVLGQLLVEGRIDERDGVWVPRALAAPIEHPFAGRRAA
jgi:hypothetical protein